MALKPYRATSHWKKIRLQVLRRDAYTCAYCSGEADQVDHVLAKVRGGEDTLDNLVAACRACNLRKSDRDAVFLAQPSTPPVFIDKISPIRTSPNKSGQIGHTSVRVDPDSPFNVSDQSGAS